MIAHLVPCLAPGELAAMQSEVAALHASDALVDYVQALLAHGADPNLASTVPMRVTGAAQGLVRVSTSPLFEAHRLQRPQIAQALARQGAKSHIASQAPKG